MAKGQQNAISPTRAEDFPEWYQQVVRAADMAENSETRGCMVIKPWGYGLWEKIQRQLARDVAIEFGPPRSAAAMRSALCMGMRLNSSASASTFAPSNGST